MPVNRTVIARRASATPSTRPTTLGTNPAMRVDRTLPPVGAVRRTGFKKGQGSGDAGYRSEWARTTDAPYGGWR